MSRAEKGTCQYQAKYKEWINSKQTCACGCGKILFCSLFSFMSAVQRFGRTPMWVSGHNKRKQTLKPEIIPRPKAQKKYRNEKQATINGCTIISADYGKRCPNFLNCSSYEKCMSFVADAGWQGWKIKEKK